MALVQEPIVGTSPIERPAARASATARRSSATVRTVLMWLFDSPFQFPHLRYQTDS